MEMYPEPPTRNEQISITTQLRTKGTCVREQLIFKTFTSKPHGFSIGEETQIRGFFFGKRPHYWSLSYVFLMVRLVLWVLGRKTTKIKCRFYYIV